MSAKTAGEISVRQEFDFRGGGQSRTSGKSVFHSGRTVAPHRVFAIEVGAMMLVQRTLEPRKESDQFALAVRIGLSEDTLDLIAHREARNTKLLRSLLRADPSGDDRCDPRLRRG
jgi:hypothetical protein